MVKFANAVLVEINFGFAVVIFDIGFDVVTVLEFV